MPQSLAKIYVHIAFSTKERRPYFSEPTLKAETYAYLASVFAAHDSPALLIGGADDHVHILCNMSRTKALANVIKEAKRASSLWIKTKGSALTSFRWQGGYGAFSVSHSNVSRVRRYIAGQEEHHRKWSFQDEFRRLLQRHGVEYDERYVWD